MLARTTRAARLRLWLIVLIVAAGLALASLACGERVEEPLVEDTPTPTVAPTETSTPTETATVTPSPTPTLTPSPTPTPTPDPYVSPLTGRRVDDLSLIHRRVLAIRVGNDPNIRPQDGLGMADVVYEEIMDGWSVTRFVALYLESSPERVRPLRSARLSSLYLIPQYDAANVHTGASNPIRWLISQEPFVDLDEFFHPKPYRLLAGYDWRGRMYTSVELIHAYLEEKGLQRDEPIEGYLFDEAPPNGDLAEEIRIPYPSSCAVRWEYDNDSGQYMRYVQGRPHLDNLDGEQIAAENVIIFYTEHRRTDIVEDSLGATAIDIVLNGEGRAQLCRDGVVQEVIWRERGPSELIEYYDEDGERVPLKPGRTWIQIVPPDYEVTIE